MKKPNPLRSTGRQAIVDVLGKSYFTKHNFEVNFDELKNEVEIALVRFLINRDFYFKIIRNTGHKSDEMRYLTEECPGKELLEPVRYLRGDFDACMSALVTWTSRMLEELRANSPIYDEFEELRDTLLKDLSKHVNDPAAHFSPAEITHLQGKLDSLAEKFDELQKRNAINESDLKNVKAELNKLKGDLTTFPKEAWYKTAGNKVIDIIGSVCGSKEGRELMVSTTKALMSGDTQKPQ